MDEVLVLVDRLASDLLVDGIVAPPGELARVAARTTESLSALKAYLNGEHKYRAGRYSPAAESFHLAKIGYFLNTLRDRPLREACDALDRAAELDPDNIIVLVHKALLAVKAGRPDDVGALTRRALVLLDRGSAPCRRFRRIRETDARTLPRRQSAGPTKPPLGDGARIPDPGADGGGAPRCARTGPARESAATSPEVVVLNRVAEAQVLLEAGRAREAAERFRRALFSPVTGYTRTNYELARTLLSLGRPEEARAHFRWVEAAWGRGEPEFLRSAAMLTRGSRADPAGGRGNPG